MNDQGSSTSSREPGEPTGAAAGQGAQSSAGLAGAWKIGWPLVVGGLVLAGGAVASKRLGQSAGAIPPPTQLGPSTPPPAPKAPEPEAGLAPKPAAYEPYEDALRPQGTREFFRYCRDMDQVMNLEGVEALARKRLARVPDSYLAWAILGYVSEWRNDREGARTAYQHAKHLLDGDREMAAQPIQARAEMEMICTGQSGIYLFCRGDQDARFVTCRKAVVDRPTDDGAWFVLGLTASSRQNFAVMALCADKLETLNPSKAQQFKEACIEPMKARLGAMRGGGVR